MSKQANEPHVTIIGSGVGGIGMAMQLIRHGRNHFTILEKADDIGGTWRDNDYPGCACDVPSHFYSFSFETRGDWSRVFPERKEIHAYLNGLTDKYRLRKKTRFNSEVVSAKFDEKSQKWNLTLTNGDTLTTDVVVTALGQLNRPKVPEIKGQNDFEGAIFHSAEWQHDAPIDGKKVAVIGNGPSAAQFIPEVAKVAKEMTVFQRSPCHVVPRNDKEYGAIAKFLFAFAGVRRLYRGLLYYALERNFTIFNETKKSRFMIKLLNLPGDMTKAVADHFDEQVTDPALREVLKPDYAIGCKRVVISDDYYPALQRENVTVETSGIEKITKTGIQTVDGETHVFDSIVYGTGFASTDFLAPLDVSGTQGVDLNSAWKDGAEAYLGITMPNFPNFFMLYGPNTNLGHNSIIFMIECQVNYVLSCLDKLDAQKATSMNLKASSMAEFADFLKARMETSVFVTECDSWYKNESGKVTNNWPEFTYVYQEATQAAKEEDYDFNGTNQIAAE
ncbi:MAG: NAD(P)/FAD-dependent oxidoreductase [Rhodobiaceae bacterium]|jgi:cation diffusion facilitator CzcD-associated flavoprotein CzcO|nr:NAD(P)/FAD-dependent oxidoreductase [Rhodobiaceae bacterium]